MYIQLDFLLRDRLTNQLAGLSLPLVHVLAVRDIPAGACFLVSDLCGRFRAMGPGRNLRMSNPRRCPV